MRYCIATFVFVFLAATWACGDPSGTLTCAGNTYFKNGKCVPRSPDICGECASPTPACDVVAVMCVECTQTLDCSNESASRCNTEEHTCSACQDNADCEHIEGSPYCNASTHRCVPCDCTDDAKPVCEPDSGDCVECTIATEADQCGEHSCNPATFQCTGTERGTVITCGPCVADSECASTHRCIPMHFKGTPREGGYCLQLVSEGTCTRPYTSGVVAESLSGAGEAEYCGINQDLVTCEAAHDGVVAKGCSANTDCGAEGLDDGLCRDFGGLVGSICTYECSVATECSNGQICPDKAPDPDYCDNPS